ncbi:MAG: molybdopterin cofactor-binding domain-containing protein [Pirellulaceae bacterium]
MSIRHTEEEFREVERYEMREPRAYVFTVSRREFVQALGAGIMIAVVADSAWAQRRGSGRTARRDESLADRFHIAEDGTITVLTSKVEVGQGSRTQITQAAAEELRVSLETIQLLMADTGRCPDDGGTAGSRTTPSTVPRVRAAAAAAREVLVNLAAETLAVDHSQVTAVEGQFRASDGRTATMAELVKNAQLSESLAAGHSADEATLNAVEQWQVLGQPIRKVNGADVVRGRAAFPSDIVLPKMLYGKVLRPDSYGANLKSIDLAPAQALDGVTVVHDENFVGCTARTSWEATTACESLAASAQWSKATQIDDAQLFDHFRSTAREGRGSDEQGDWAAALRTATKKIKHDYTVAYIQHAPMEPRAAVAQWDDNHLTVWTGSQQPSRVHGELVQTFRLRDDQVRVIVPDTGGGFGGKHTGEVAVEAARLAMAAGQPVHLRWTREEEFTWAYFRPAGLIEVHAAVDDAGKVVAWDFANYNSGGSAIDTPYRVASRRTRFLSTDSPLRQGSYRALASTANTFAREVAMDELAELAGVDPVAFRWNHLEDGRLKNVLESVVGKFNWDRRRHERKPNRGMGMACGTEKGSFVAACAEVTVEHDKIHVERICQAFECGAIQNPLNLRMQVEGCIVMGLGGALFEAMEFANGRIKNASFGSYRVPRMSDVPELDIHLLDRKDLPSVGAGETPIIAVAPAIANAVYDAVGKRCRSLPLKLT